MVRSHFFFFENKFIRRKKIMVNGSSVGFVRSAWLVMIVFLYFWWFLIAKAMLSSGIPLNPNSKIRIDNTAVFVSLPCFISYIELTRANCPYMVVPVPQTPRLSNGRHSIAQRGGRELQLIALTILPQLGRFFMVCIDCMGFRRMRIFCGAERGGAASMFV